MNTTSQPQRVDGAAVNAKLPRAEAVRRYNELHAKINDMGKALLQLMRNPDATDEQLAKGRAMYFAAYTLWIASRIALRATYSSATMPWQATLPWDMPEDL